MEILTPFQKELLKRIGATALADSFFLTGGTGLSAFYLQHRFSEDLDFFSAEAKAIQTVPPTLIQLASDLNTEVDFPRRFNTFIECFIGDPTGEQVKLDFAYDAPFRLQPTEAHPEYGIAVDNWLDISTNKLSALFDRAEPKDFVDVYFICQELITFDELLVHARKKHVGMDDYWLAVALQRVRQVAILPHMIKPMTIKQLHNFFLPIAKRLLDTIDR